MNEYRIRDLLPLLLKYRIAFAVVVLLGLLQAALEGIVIGLIIPLLHNLIAEMQPQPTGRWFVDEVQMLFRHIAPDRRLTVIALCLFSAIVATAVTAYSRGLLFSWVDGKISHYLRRRIFAQLLVVSFGFIERDRSGRLLNILASDSWRTGEALKIVINLITTASMLAVYVVLLLLMSWQMTLIAAAAMFLVSRFLRLFTRSVGDLAEKAIRANSEMGHRMVEGIDGMQVIRSFNRENHEQRRFDDISNRLRLAFLRMSMLEGAVHPVHEILISGLLLLVVFATGRSPNDMSIVLVFLFVLYRLQPRVKELEACRVRFDALRPSVNEVLSLLETRDKQYLASGDFRHPGLEDGIEFNQVTFRYDQADTPALKDVSFLIPAGRTTALVGPSGSGKTTIVKLILRFHDPLSGTVMADGHSLQNLDLGAWRDQIAFVSQDCYLFSSTVRENIAYGRLDATREEIVEAARQADAHEFIEALPEKYDTVLGHHGARLSGGQRQKISLARAIVRNPRILILDEATNALDSISEQWIQETLQKLRGNRTVIVIAHRLATVEEADRIIVLEHGKVHEWGTLPELMIAEGLFARLYQLQHRRRPVTVQGE